MKLIRKSFRSLKRGIYNSLSKGEDLRSAKESLLSSEELQEGEGGLLEKVSLTVSPHDGAYRPFGARHYLSVGLSAIRCIEIALNKIKSPKAIQSVLDFPCGYGRVLRFLKVRFPNAEITSSDINIKALDFCKQEFSGIPLVSDKDFKKVTWPDKFDLIWCGSLITHFDAGMAADLLQFFNDHLNPGGLCVFTTHGQFSVDRVQRKPKTYGLRGNDQRKMLAQFNKSGYGYVDYKSRPGYGMSVISQERMLAMAQAIGGWNNILHLEHGWDKHQDVYVFVKT